MSEASVRDDVLQNLQFICRTRLGSAPSAPQCGLPDLTDVLRSNIDTATLVVRALKYTIETHEPRLTGLRIVHIPGEEWDHVLKFQITATIVIGNKRSPVTFETRIDPSRRVVIR